MGYRNPFDPAITFKRRTKKEMSAQKVLPLNPHQMIALADGNSFYCSCEESVQPWLHGKPIIVASNNDGCAIAMNRQAKPFVKMGEALFQITNTIKEHGIVTFSSNYELYGDISNRMHSNFASYVPNYEVYSIDYQNLNIIKSRSLILFRIKCNGIRLST